MIERLDEGAHLRIPIGRIALQALLAHPLVPSFATAQSLLAALLAEHRDYLPQFVSEFVSLEEAQ